jgi:hypothetical protein
LAIHCFSEKLGYFVLKPSQRQPGKVVANMSSLMPTKDASKSFKPLFSPAFPVSFRIAHSTGATHDPDGHIMTDVFPRLEFGEYPPKEREVLLWLYRCYVGATECHRRRFCEGRFSLPPCLEPRRGGARAQKTGARGARAPRVRPQCPEKARTPATTIHHVELFSNNRRKGLPVPIGWRANGTIKMKLGWKRIARTVDTNLRR